MYMGTYTTYTLQQFLLDCKELQIMIASLEEVSIDEGLWFTHVFMFLILMLHQ